jgi:hypothetical protein
VRFNALRAAGRHAVLAALLGGALLALPARADENVRAVWQVQEVFIPYFGLTTQYSCDGIRDKMRGILTRLGMRDDFVVRVGGCIELTGPVRNPTLSIVLANAVPADDAMTKTFANDKKRAELVALLEKKSKTTQSDQPFDAVRKVVTFKNKERGADMSSAAGDCELLEHVRRYLVPKIGAKIVKDEVNCTPHQGTVGIVEMQIEALMPVAAK